MKYSPIHISVKQYNYEKVLNRYIRLPVVLLFSKIFIHAPLCNDQLRELTILKNMASPPLRLANSGLPHLILIFTFVFMVSSVNCFDQQCKRLTHPACNISAGYNFTAPFPPINGTPYQDVKGAELSVHLPLLKSCSKYSATVLCSLHFPKCVPGIPRPVLPCRSVCNDFVQSCISELNLAAMYGILTAMCDLLPKYNNNTNDCFLPEGFNISRAKSGLDKNICHKVGIQQCSDDLHYNYTFVSNNTQTLSNFHVLQGVVTSGCSPNVEKFTCFTRFPPCFDGNMTTVQVPCKSLCNEISSACKDEFKRYGIPPSDCNILYPDSVGSNDLCKLSKWPAPWPKTVRTPSIPICPTMPVPTSYPECKKCAPVTIKHCEKAGYKETFHFDDIDGKPYQEVKAKSLFSVPLLSQCSKLTQTILCSIYVPKCDERTCSSKPVLPCRSVCHQFVRDCEAELRLAAQHGLMIGLCDLLPLTCTSETPCFIPDNFQRKSEAYQRGVCFPISNSHNPCARDLYYNRTFLTPSDQMKVQFHLLQQVVASKCSPYVERFFCYTRLPPCSSNSTKDVSVALPCRWLCKKVIEDCKEVFKKYSIPLADCDFLPEEEGVDGMCTTRTFPVPLRHIKNETNKKSGGNKGANAGLIVGIVFAVIIVAILILVGMLYYRWRKQKKPFEPKELHNIETKT